MKSSKRHFISLSLIFLLKCYMLRSLFELLINRPYLTVRMETLQLVLFPRVCFVQQVFPEATPICLWDYFFSSTRTQEVQLYVSIETAALHFCVFRLDFCNI